MRRQPSLDTHQHPLVRNFRLCCSCNHPYVLHTLLRRRSGNPDLFQRGSKYGYSTNPSYPILRLRKRGPMSKDCKMHRAPSRYDHRCHIRYSEGSSPLRGTSDIRVRLPNSIVSTNPPQHFVDQEEGRVCGEGGSALSEEDGYSQVTDDFVAVVILAMLSLLDSYNLY